MVRKVIKVAPKRVTGNIIMNDDDPEVAAAFAAAISPKDATKPAKASPTAKTLEEARALVAEADAVYAAQQAANDAAAAATNAAAFAQMSPQQQSVATMSALLMKKVTIILEDNPDIPPTGLFIGYNGYSFVLRPGVEAVVPLPLTEILDNARSLMAVVDPATQRIIGHRSKLRFPYREIKRAA